MEEKRIKCTGKAAFMHSFLCTLLVILLTCTDSISEPHFWTKKAR